MALFGSNTGSWAMPKMNSAKQGGADFIGDADGATDVMAAAQADLTAEQAYANTVAASNPYRASEWYLDGYLTPGSNAYGANVDRISTEYTGAGVRIGLIDQGFDISNPDLAGRFDLSLSYDPRDTGTVNI